MLELETLLAIFGVGFVGIVIGVVLGYFIPTVIATVNRHPHQLGVVLLNLLLGWTGFGWAAALVWAVVPLTNKEDAERSSERS